jgi:hypothetical protein
VRAATLAIEHICPNTADLNEQPIPKSGHGYFYSRIGARRRPVYVSHILFGGERRFEGIGHAQTIWIPRIYISGTARLFQQN